ncbi:MAG: prolipoprotein diacylglyceryl transferase [Verrucomicrobia bacterium]|nr:prolipoprotein diacylglyceryl transferase [Verrucomicrobiota bacterium]MDE3046787.1 prolipoprotein diacylglyceryl transferase [Verrucomicrobiota bacterium]
MLSLSVIYWDPKPELFRIPYLDWPILWYGALFALGFALGFPIFVGILTRFFGGKATRPKAVQIADRLTLYMILGTVIGARLGHFLFYEHPAHYLRDPLQVFRIWEGGLASHGGAVGIIVALILFSWRVRSYAPELTWIRLLDFVAAPAALAGCCIRIGNFMNQEILGTESRLPWAVVFGHPADRSLPYPRHPVQIYEALVYLGIFFFLWKLTFKPPFLKAQGKLIGLFLILVFGFRFLIEFWKSEQSHLVASSVLTMGGWLSLPLVALGFFFYFYRRRPSFF